MLHMVIGPRRGCAGIVSWVQRLGVLISVLGLDLPGPYKRSQDELSQRRRYMLTAVYTVPVDVNGRPLLAESQSPDNLV